jgi:hypothetical protein
VLLTTDYIVLCYIATDYRLEFPGSIPGSGKHFLFSIASKLALGTTQSFIQWVLRMNSTMVKRAEREANLYC